MDQHRISRRTLGRLAGATALTGTAAATTAASAHAASSTFKVATLNIKYDLGEGKFIDDLNNVVGRADLIGLQETAPRRDRLEQWARNHPGFSLFIPAGYFAGENAMLARSSVFTRLSQGKVFVCDTGGEGSAPPPRYISWATYRHGPSGRKVTHINTHLNSNIEDGGHPNSQWPRTADAEKHIRMVRNLVTDKSPDSEVVVTGDFNVDYVDDKRVGYENFPYAVLDERQQGSLPGLRSSYSRIGVTSKGTHKGGGAHLDYVYGWIRKAQWRRLEMKGHYVFDDTHSDHNGLVTTFTLQH